MPDRPGTTADGTSRLQIRALSKSYPGVVALDNVDLSVRAGEIHALLGQNGAGKSTLIKILTGAVRRDSGEILLDGQAVALRTPRDANRLGISAVHQEINLLSGMSVAENIMLGRLPVRSLGRIDRTRLRREAAAALARLDIHIDLDTPLGTLPIAARQQVAIARAVSVDARVLVLDEPTSSLDAADAGRLFAVMRRLASNGLAIIFVTHFLDQVYEVADRMTVLRNGRFVGTFEPASTPRLDLIGAMLGREIETNVTQPPSSPIAKERSAAPRAPFLSVRNLRRRPALRSMEVDVDRGEIVALVGLLGSGRTETARIIFGLDCPDQGAIRIDNRAYSRLSPAIAIRAGLGFVPEDRARDGVFPSLSVGENMIIAHQAKRGVWRRLSKQVQGRIVSDFIRDLGITVSDAEAPIALLSGGSQQKAVLARCLAADPVILILDEPTRGIDVGARAEIENLIRRLAASSMGILFISSELQEITRVATRAVILRDRARIADLPAGPFDEPTLIRALAADPSPIPSQQANR